LAETHISKPDPLARDLIADNEPAMASAGHAMLRPVRCAVTGVRGDGVRADGVRADGRARCGGGRRRARLSWRRAAD